MSRKTHTPMCLTSVSTEFEAEVIANRLREWGIPAATTGGFTTGIPAETSAQVAVLVPQSRMQEARQVLPDRTWCTPCESSDAAEEEEIGDDRPGWHVEMVGGILCLVVGVITRQIDFVVSSLMILVTISLLLRFFRCPDHATEIQNDLRTNR